PSGRQGEEEGARRGAGAARGRIPPVGGEGGPAASLAAADLAGRAHPLEAPRVHAALLPGLMGLVPGRARRGPGAGRGGWRLGGARGLRTSRLLRPRLAGGRLVLRQAALLVLPAGPAGAGVVAAGDLVRGTQG